MTIIDLLDITKGSVVAVIGCGGKTSLVELLANGLRDRKVLVSTTTKIYPMKASGISLCETLDQCKEHKPHTGIQCLGLLNTASGKLEALPGEFLAELIPFYDITLLEADGSRGLPCKGWLNNEPVVPHFCTHTVGIVTMDALGRPADETTVHRLPEFLSLTGLKEGEIITEQAIMAMVCDPQGMFKNSAERRYLIVNKTENDTILSTTRSFFSTIKRLHPNCFERLLYGSIHQDTWMEA